MHDEGTAAVFDVEYGRWVEEHSNLMFQLVI